MKKPNCICEFSTQRSQLLIKNFREALARQSKISAAIAFKDAAEAPVPRFWVSEARAARIVNALFQGVDLLENMHPNKKEMYLEIFRRVKEIKKKNPSMAIGDIVFEVVNNPAPKSYISPVSVARIVYSSRTRKLRK